MFGRTHIKVSLAVSVHVAIVAKSVSLVCLSTTRLKKLCKQVSYLRMPENIAESDANHHLRVFEHSMS